MSIRPQAQPIIRPRIPLPTDPSVPKYGTTIDYAVARFAAATMRQHHLDAQTTELVRLRCARHHDCRLCSSLRTVDSVDEATASQVDDYESSDLDERSKAALRLTDAMIMHPRDVSPDLVADARRLLTEVEIAELLLDVVKWSQQKASVALRIEPPPRDGLSALSFDSGGRPAVGGALTPTS